MVTIVMGADLARLLEKQLDAPLMVDLKNFLFPDFIHK
jgi:hypothetical protein